MSFIIRALGRWLRSWRAGDTYLTSNLPGFKDVPQSIKLTSPDFEQGSSIPIKHAGKGVGDNVAPALKWERVPAGTKELAIVLEDIDVPLSRPAIHTIATGISPKLKELPQGALNVPEKGQEPSKMLTLQYGWFKFYGYYGPRPIPGHGPHTYIFQLMALDAELSLPAPAHHADVIKAMEGHVLALGRLDGTYEQL